ncbi:hypothetical protein BIW11_10810, partial [Tropilaelaps mercedesae]
DCGRYAHLLAVPSPWWRLAVALAGTSCSLALLVFFIIVLCCAVENSVSRISARLVGALQVFGDKELLRTLRSTKRALYGNLLSCFRVCRSINGL